jgi:hypothetical protein
MSMSFQRSRGSHCLQWLRGRSSAYLRPVTGLLDPRGSERAGDLASQPVIPKTEKGRTSQIFSCVKHICCHKQIKGRPQLLWRRTVDVPDLHDPADNQSVPVPAHNINIRRVHERDLASRILSTSP